MTNDADNKLETRPWERQRGESPVAYQAFMVYRDLGAARTFVAAANALGKGTSLVRRWARRYDWRDRTWAWDISQAREAEDALRQQREESLRRQARDADQLQRLGMAGLSRLIHRDPVTGEARLDETVKPRDAVAIYKFGVELEDRITQTAPAEPAEDISERELKRMSTEQLHQLLALAKERSEQKGNCSDDDDDGDE